MDPSHAKKYKHSEIEQIVNDLLAQAYSDEVSIPVEIDLIVERHPEVDDLIPAELEEPFKVAAVLLYKPERHAFDILFDENTPRGRTSFSIAHELGHIALHGEVCKTCVTLDVAIDLRTRLKRSYSRIEADADHFAKSILMPRRRVLHDTAGLYEGLVRLYGCDAALIRTKLCPNLARQYKVSIRAMEIRLEQLGLQKEVAQALRNKFATLDI